MLEAEIKLIEEKLCIILPSSYRSFLLREREEDGIDDVTVMEDPAQIIGLTLEYRNGFAGLKPWPSTLVYLGDEADACPYVINCSNRRVHKLDKGNHESEPIRTWENFEQFISEKENGIRQPLSTAKKRKNATAYHVPLVLGMIGFFVILPAVGIGIKLLIEWLSAK